MKPLLASFACIALAVPSYYAGERTVRCRIISVAQGAGTPERFELAGGAVSIPGATILTGATTEVRVPEDGVLKFTEGKGDEARIVGEVEVPLGADEVVVFAVPNADPDDAVLYRFAAFRSRPAELKKGGVVVFNGLASGTKVAVGGVSEPVAAGASAFLQPPAEMNNFNMAPVRVEVEVGGRWRTLKDGGSRFGGEAIQWFVIYREAGLKRPKLRIFK